MLTSIFYILTGISFLGVLFFGMKRKTGETMTEEDKIQDSVIRKRVVILLATGALSLFAALIAGDNSGSPSGSTAGLFSASRSPPYAFLHSGRTMNLPPEARVLYLKQ